MYVEQILWVVPREQRTNSVNLLTYLSHSMDASGGLLGFAVGSDTSQDEHLMAVSFWKGWEELSRFLAHTKTSLLDESRAPSDRLKLHHFEIIWEWPKEEVDTIRGESHWAVHDFWINDEQVESLLDEIRRSAPALKKQAGFSECAIWIDKNHGNHVVFAAEWLFAKAPQPLMPLLKSRLKSVGVSENQHTEYIFKLKAVRPSLLEVS